MQDARHAIAVMRHEAADRGNPVIDATGGWFATAYHVITQT